MCEHDALGFVRLGDCHTHLHGVRPWHIWLLDRSNILGMDLQMTVYKYGHWSEWRWQPVRRVCAPASPFSSNSPILRYFMIFCIQPRSASLALHTGPGMIEGVAWRWTGSFIASLIRKVATILARTSTFKFYFQDTRLTIHSSRFFKQFSTIAR